MKRSLRWGGRGSILLAALTLCALGSVSPGMADGGLEALSIEPAHIPKDTTAGSSVARIRGLGFTPSATVTFDTTSATVTFIDSRTLQVVIPTSATGKVSTVTVTDAGHTDTIYPFLYTDANLYVRTTGNDNSNGTTPALAKKTIGGALAVASTSTTTLIRIAGGSYPEWNLAIFSGVVLSGGWDVNFTLRDPDQQVSVVDGGRSGFLVRSGGIDAAQILDGLTLANGVRDGLGGGGVVISGDHTVVTNSVLVGNQTSSRGGAIYAVFTTSYGGSPIVSNSVMLGNRAFANLGGAIGIYPFYTQGQVLDVAVSDNFIMGNRSFGNRGGGVGVGTQTLYTYNQLRLQMVGNVLGGNKALAGAGVSLLAAGSGDRYDLLLDNNLLFGNGATGEGGGLQLSGVGHFSGRITGNTMAGNTAGADGGGGIRFSPSPVYEPAFDVENLILAGNSNGDLAGTPLATYSLVEGGSPGTGNLSGSPGFVAGPMGPYYLAQDANTMSPAVDTGSQPAQLASMEARTTSAQLSLDGGLVDMGYHYPAAVAPSPDPLTFGRVDPARGDPQGQDWVLIRGKGFDPGIAVSFDGVAATETLYVSGSRVLARPAPHLSGAVSVTLTNTDLGTVTQPGAYTYVDNLPPAWVTTVGLQQAASSRDCVRSAVLTWNPAVDAMTPPVKYTIFREECIPASGNFQNPCTNFGYFPAATNQVATTYEPSWIDVNFGSGGADPKYIYLVRAGDAIVPVNTEFNYSKRLIKVSKLATDNVPPSPVGNTLDVLEPNIIEWAGAVGAVSYRLYRQTNPAAYAGAVSPLITLTTANNNTDGDSVTDSRYVDSAIPAAGSCFFYKVSALDPCNIESTSDLLP